MKRRYGFTILELFVVIGIIGLLVALLAPAVGAAREAARGAKCLSNLRQIGLAAHQYEGVHHMFPAWRQFYEMGSPWEFSVNDCSVLAQFLPYLDQSELYDALNLSKGRVPDEDDATAPEWDMLATAMNRRVDVFLCPSDGGPFRAGVNYRGCLGSGPMHKFNGEFPDSGNGFFCPIYDSKGGGFPIRVATVTDGLTQTAMFSERLRGSGATDRFDPKRDATALPSDPTTADATVVRCRRLHEAALAGGTSWNPWLGKTWILTGMSQTLYNHVMPPNSAVADCGAPADWAGPTSARSAHPGGVHVLFGDGSTRFVGDSVDLRVWRALGTRNGGEAILVGSY